MYTNLLLKSKALLFLFLLCSINIITAQTETINIDFGSETSQTSPLWNNITNPASGVVYNLVNSNSASTGISIAITDDFLGSSNTNTAAVSETLKFPSTAISDFFYGGTTNPTAGLLLTNLFVDKEYTIKLFASRNASPADNRQTTYTVNGLISQSASVDASNNVNNVATITFKPKIDGTAVITIAKGTSNNNTSGFFYLNAIELTYSTATPVYSNNALLVDFGSSTNTTASNWNNLTNATTGSISGLKNNGGTTTAINLAVTDAFNFVNTEGTVTAGLSLGIPCTATADSFFGNTAAFLEKTETTGAVKYSNFDPNLELSLKIYASRVEYVAKDNRETKYTIDGLTTKTIYLNAANNTNSFASAQIKPKADGTLTITVTKGENNTNENGFFYLGAMIIDYVPAEPTLSLTSPNGGEFWQAGKVVDITWNSASLTSSVNLDYSVNSGATWTPIATVSNSLNSYSWTVPATVSANCLLRATSALISDTSDAVFEISNDTNTCNIVVIGSSTAEGIGASTGNGWVDLYKKALYKKNTQLNVVNLGKGGYTTYKVLPTGTATTIPTGVTIDVNSNITKALTYNPIAVIINMPSNDTENGYSVTSQQNNYNEINTIAAASSVPLYVATTQPRNFTTSATVKTQDQIAVRDWIITTYGSKAINFWTDIADVDGTILSNLNAGDGTHLNDAGHLILFNKVLAANIQSLKCETGGTLGVAPFIEDEYLVYTYPNPVKDELNLSFNAKGNGAFTIQLYDVLGKQILQKSASFYAGSNNHTFTLNNVKSQVVMGKILFKKENGDVYQKQLKLSVK